MRPVVGLAMILAGIMAALALGIVLLGKAEAITCTGDVYVTCSQGDRSWVQLHP